MKPKNNWKFKINSKFIVLVFILLAYLLLTKTEFISGNEKSRYATIESLVERSTFVIDNSTFIDTNDKALINGHFYSDKPALLSIIGAGVYFVLYNIFGLSLKSNMNLVVLIINFLLVSLPTIVTLYLFYKILAYLKIREKYQHILVLSLGLATLALPYALVFGNHIASANLSFFAFYLIAKNKFIKLKKFEFCLVGLFLGLSFAIDIVSGGIFLAAFSVYNIFNLFKSQKDKLLFYFFGALLPIILYAYLSISISGDLLPASMHPEFWDYPGSTFSKENLTGFAAHDSLKSLLIYAFHELIGYRGLFSYTPLLLLPLYFLIKSSINKKHQFSKEALMIIVSIIIIISFYTFTDKEFGGYSYGMRYFVAFTPLLFFFTAFYFKGDISRKKMKLYFILAFASLFIALVGAYNPWADSFGYPAFFNQPIPFLNNLRFIIEDVLNALSPQLLSYIKELI